MRAKLIAALLLASVMPGMMAGSTGGQLRAVREKLQNGLPLTLASIGDSITWICFHTDARRNYLTFVADALQKRYPAARIRLEQSGNRGSTVRAMPFLETLLEVKPDLVFVMFGMNDSHRGPGQLDDYDANLTKLIRRIREAKAVPVILTQNEIVYPADGRDALPMYVARAREVARREDVLLVDNFSDWQQLQKEEPDTWKLYLNDVMHPDLAGHRRFAKAILKQLWPEAAELHYSGLWPLADKLPPAIECLVPGPTDKQVLRIGRSTWVTLTGRRRGEEVTDLVLSVANKIDPGWKDFRHVDLIGPSPQAVFPWGERSINSALLLRNERRLFIFFSHAVRRSLLTIDTTRSGWIDRLTERAAYETLDHSDVPLPQSMGGSYQEEDTEYLDGYVDGANPVLFYRDLLLNMGQGIVRMSLPKGESSVVLPRAMRAAAGHSASHWFAAGQTDESSRILVASSDKSALPSPPIEPRRFSFGVFGSLPLLVGRTQNAAWRALRWNGNKWEEVALLPSARQADALAPLAIQGAAALLSREGEWISAYVLRGGGFERLGERHRSPGGPWRYEGAPPRHDGGVGLLRDHHGLTFSIVRLPPR